MNLYKKILVAIDLSEDAPIVLQKAQEIALANNTPLNLLHVMEPLSVAYGANTSFNLFDMEKELTASAKKHINELSDTVNIPEENQYIAHGIPEKEVHNMAKEIGADLIITGNHGRHGFSLILGSTSTAVLHGAPCDVFTIRVGQH